MIFFDIDFILFLDWAVIVTLIVVASLSKRLGIALKTPPYYYLFFIAIAMILIAELLTTDNTLTFLNSLEPISIIATAMRFMGGIIASYAIIQYWRWLFDDFFRK